jgi:hypothetical protein
LVALAIAVVAGGVAIAVPGGQLKSPGTGNAITLAVNPARATALLAKLAAPAGFERGPCSPIPSYGDSVCFRRSRSVVLDRKLMAALVASFGAKLDTQLDHALGRNASTPSACVPSRQYQISHAATPRLTLIACNVLAKRGSQHLNISATSLVLADAKSIVATTRDAPHTPGGSEIMVTDDGS